MAIIPRTVEGIKFVNQDTTVVGRHVVLACMTMLVRFVGSELYKSLTYPNFTNLFPIFVS